MGKKNVVVTQHGIIQEELKYQQTIMQYISFYVKSYIANIVLGKISNLIQISEYNRRILKKYRVESFKNEDIIPNSLSEKSFKKLYYKSVNKIAFVGHISRLKGLDILLRSIEILKQENIHYHINVFGEFRDKYYKKQIFQILKEKDLTESVTFHGWKTHDDLKELTSDIPILVLPSRQENLPMSIAEAMAESKVVLASKISGIPEMFEHEKSGFLFEKEDSLQLASQLKELYQNDTLVEKIGSIAHDKALEFFNARDIALKTVNFYKRCLQ